LGPKMPRPSTSVTLFLVLCATIHAQDLLDDDGTVDSLPLWMEEAGDQWSQAHPSLLKKPAARRMNFDQRKQQEVSPEALRFSQVADGEQAEGVGQDALELGKKAGEWTKGKVVVAADAVGDTLTTAAAGISKGTTKAIDAIKGVDWKGVGTKVKDGIVKGAQATGKALKKGGAVVVAGAVIAGRHIHRGAKAAAPHLKKAGIALGNAAKAAGSAGIKGGVAFYHNFMIGEEDAISVPPPTASPEQYKVKPVDIEDCTACKFIWNQVEMDVGNTPLEEEIFKSFQSNCAEASLSRIFYPSCSLMSNHIQDFIIDYNKGFDPNQLCEHNGMCRTSLLFYPSKKKE